VHRLGRDPPPGRPHHGSFCNVSTE
jgi:hypothetical protein